MHLSLGGSKQASVGMQRLQQHLHAAPSDEEEG